MEKSFGTRRMSKPKGMFREVHWTSLATMDQWTADGRRLNSAGGGVRELPRQFSFQFKALPAHLEAVPVGTLDQVIFHDDGNLEGWGWLADNEDGHKAAFAIETGMQSHNSVDLAEVEVEIDIDWDAMEMKIDFTKWNIGKTTGVAMPAFADARMELTDEIVASMREAGPLEITCGSQINLETPVPEMTASVASTVPWADFHIPESDEPHKVIVDAEGRVYGHIALWDDAHRGYEQSGIIKFCPRPTDNYRHYNHAGPLTENGQVGTGPVFLIGGHPKDSMRGRSVPEIHDAYGNVENTWADVRVVAGKYGPWVSGRIRPGLSDDLIYKARASHVSGHWIDDELVAIVSCNVPAFRPGAGFAAVEEGRVVELVASFPEPPSAEEVTVPGTMTFGNGSITFTQPTTTKINMETFPIIDWSKFVSSIVRFDSGSLDTGVVDDGSTPSEDIGREVRRRRLALEMDTVDE